MLSLKHRRDEWKEKERQAINAYDMGFPSFFYLFSLSLFFYLSVFFGILAQSYISTLTLNGITSRYIQKQSIWPTYII
jgi:hypothetical protein